MGRTARFTKEEEKVAITILAKYDSVKTVQHGGKRLSQENNAAAYETFVATTRRQIDRAQWRKLAQRLRMREAEKASTNGIEGNRRGHLEKLVEETENMLSDPDGGDGDPRDNVEADPDGDTESFEVMQDDAFGNEDPVTDEVNSKSRKMEYQELSDTLEDLHLQLITIGDWILVQRAIFDIHVNEEPYHSVQIYANLKSMKFIRRVWGISERSGELRTKEDMRDLCIATFNMSAVCLGHITPDSGRDLDLVKVKYPFTRWISDSCHVRYSRDQSGKTTGICSACSGGAPNIKEICIKSKIKEPHEFLTEEDLKYENEDVQEEDMKREQNDGDDWSEYYEPDSETNIDEDYKDVTMDDNENGMEQVLSEEVGENDDAKIKESNEAYWQNIRNEPTDTQDTQNDDEIGRLTSYTKKEKNVAKALLAKYKSLKPETHGGNRMSKWDNIAALDIFNSCTRTSYQTTLNAWRKLCSKLRCEEGKRLDSDPNDQVIDYGLEEALLAIEKKCEDISKATIDKNSVTQADTKENLEESNDEMKNNKIGRTANTTNEQKEVAITILAKYNSLKALQHGGERLSQENNAAAHEVYVATTGHQIDRDQWRKLAQRLRMEETEKAYTSSSPVLKSEPDHFSCAKCQETFTLGSRLQKHMRRDHKEHNDDLDQALLAIEIQHEKPQGMEDNKKLRTPKITRDMREVAINILAKYNSLKAPKHGGERLSHEDNVAAHEDFVAITGHQINLEQWRKITQSLRMKEADKKYASKSYSVLLPKVDPVHFLCADCPKTFPLRSSLRKHISRHHKKYKMQTCDKCGLSFSSVRTLDHHVKTKHTSYAEREYKCTFPGCTMAFVLAGSLKGHKRKHGERNFVCDHCGESYWNNGQLTHHLRIKHKALPELKLKCKHCEEIFPCYTTRQLHTNLIHFPERYKCSTCQKSYASDSLLKRHTQSAHQDRTFIKCQECGKQLANKSGLKVHMKLHKGELVSCSYCPWKSHIKSKLYKHMRLQHMEEWEREQEENKNILKCAECGKIVVSKAALTLHRVKVHGQKPTTCATQN